jgi:single-strand DNA-binding protein
MNIVILSGRFVNDARVVTSNDAKNPWSTAYFTLAVDNGVDANGQKMVEFIECQAWGKLADRISQYNHKGDAITIQGKITPAKAKDRNGNVFNTFRVEVKSFEFGPRKQGNAPQAQAPVQQAVPQQPVAPAQPVQAPAPKPVQKPVQRQAAPARQPRPQQSYQPVPPQEMPRTFINEPAEQNFPMPPVQQSQTYDNVAPVGYGYRPDDSVMLYSEFDPAYIEE